MSIADYHDLIVKRFTYEWVARDVLLAELKQFDPSITQHKLMDYINENNIRRTCKFCKTTLLDRCRGVRDYCKICAPTKYGVALIHSYGINKAQYDAMYTKQQGKCAICQTDLTHVKKNVDHCHSTGRVRGILCHTCNIGLGFIEKHPQFTELAQAYLKSTQPHTSMETSERTHEHELP